MTLPTFTGIVLAAGGGSRMGRPKALVRTPDGEAWVARAARTLLLAGCARVVVVLGAEAEAARALLPDGPVEVAVAADWATGMSVSLRAGLDAASRAAGGGDAGGGDAALVTLVDLPGLPVEAMRRVLVGPPGSAAGPGSLRQAVYAGRPGHPVLLGRAHWAAIAAELAGDRGARDYLARHGAEPVECGDLFDGQDVDRPD